jgi:peroxiredoxin Q/BCP
MKNAQMDKPIQDFDILGTRQLRGKLSQFRGKNLILYFYPKDNTPVCTSEAKAFKNSFDKLCAKNTVVLGVSRDSLSSHESYRQKLQLPFDLVSDSQDVLSEYFDVIKMKNFFGKQIRGIQRSTFLIDQEGVLRFEWRKVKVSQHVQEILEKL